MPSKETLEIEDAQRAIDAILSKGISAGNPFAVAIVDENGEIVLLIRQDGTSASDVLNAERKAYTHPTSGVILQFTVNKSPMTVVQSQTGPIIKLLLSMEG